MKQFVCSLIIGLVYCFLASAITPTFEPVNMGLFEGEERLVYGIKLPGALCFYDLNGDGLTDMSYSDGNYVYMNYGTNAEPFYQMEEFHSIGANSSSYAHNWVRHHYRDVNDDGLPDLLVDDITYTYSSGDYYGILKLYLNNGAMGNPLYNNYTVIYNSPWDGDIASGFLDINNDGLIDIINEDDVYMNTGTPASPVYQSDTTIVIEMNYFRCPLTIGDLNNDDAIDLLYNLNNDAGIAYYENIGTPEYPEFADPVYNFAGIDDHGDITLHDFDGDNDLDLFVESMLYENNSTGTEYQFDLLNSNYFCPLPQYLRMYSEFADWEGDGDYDYFPLNPIGNDNDIVLFYENCGTPEEPDWYLNCDTLVQLDFDIDGDYHFADLNNDGSLDLFVSIDADAGLFQIYQNNGSLQNPDYAYTNTIWLGMPCAFYDLIDIDLDDDLDIVCGNNSMESLALILNTGSPDSFFFEPYNDEYISNIGHNVIDVTCGDFDNDQDIDIFVKEVEEGYYYSEVYYSFFINDGSPLNPDWIRLNGLLPGMLEESLYSSSTSIDLNNDGFLDIIGGHAPNYGNSWLYYGLIYYRGTGFVEVPAENVQEVIPMEFGFSVHPNPFNDQAILSLSIKEPGLYNISLYDILGREVSNISKGDIAPGEYSFTISGEHLSSGIYFVTLQSDGFSNTQKIVLLK